MGLRSITRPRAILTAASIATLALISAPSAWGADPIGAYPVQPQKPAAGLHGKPHAGTGTRAWKAPPNMFVTVSARYCEDTACEPVTLRIWSGDTFVMDRLGQHHESIRIANIEAANVLAGCPTESTIAQGAKLQLMSVLQNSTFVLARVSGQKDRQSAAFVTANGRDVGKTMMDRHHARPFETPRRPWC